MVYFFFDLGSGILQWVAFPFLGIAPREAGPTRGPPKQPTTSVVGKQGRELDPVTTCCRQSGK